MLEFVFSSVLFIAVLLFNIFLYLFIPLGIVGLLGQLPFAQGYIERTLESVLLRLFTVDMLIVYAVFLIAQITLNNAFPDTVGQDGVPVFPDGRLSAYYIFFMFLNLVTLSIVFLLVYKLQIFVALFIPAYYLLPVLPENGLLINMISWYLSYVVLAVISIVAGYKVQTAMLAPIVRILREKCQANRGLSW